ncbi:MAG: hypothetical protein HEQ29_04560 [Dolichospermum sp. LBC05a]|nr:hypothetical protein [Dolichospermum sp. OL01]MCO5796081.1 hypothetical protein [Dolichospermum sp. OL03]MCS6282852.1 hypothetical protein [Dolichospermum sp.]QSV57724.1 MAG: hypothetical protein HEQ29_04560 [Dolichospermum sp. LBC05a]
MNLNTKYTYPCLFCGDNTRPRTEEHIIQHGFKNSRWVLDTDVCCHCNTDIFSPLDKKLIDFVRTYVYPNHSDISRNRTLVQAGHSIRLNEKDGRWESIRIDSDGNSIAFPQIIFVDEKRIEFCCNGNENYQQLLDKIKQELVQVDKLSLKELVFQQADQSLPKIQSAVIRTARLKYVLRASTNEEVQLLKSQIETGQLLRQLGQESKPRTISQKSKVQVNLQLETNLINRAIAKSAVNSVCAFLGSQRARNSVFDPIKSFILGDTQEDGERFVQHIWNINRNESNISQKQNFSVPGYHTVILASKERILTVLLILYEHPFALIRLTEDTNFMGEEEIYAALINYRSGSHQVLNCHNFYERFYVNNIQ